MNFFLYEALKNARYAVPFLKNMEFLLPREKPEAKKKRIAGRAATQGKSAKVTEDGGPPIDMIETPFPRSEHPYTVDIADDPKKMVGVEAFIERDRLMTVEEVKAETELLSFDKGPEYPEGMTFVKPERVNRHLGLEKEGDGGGQDPDARPPSPTNRPSKKERFDYGDRGRGRGRGGRGRGGPGRGRVRGGRRYASRRGGGSAPPPTRRMAYHGNKIIVQTKRGVDHKFSLIWLHGFEEEAKSYVKTFTDESKIDLPGSCRIVLVTGPEREMASHDGKTMHSWFDIKSLKDMPDEEAFTRAYLKDNFD